ncbi:hypothetical protein YH62_20835 [Rhizobium sp. LC145]|jgi:hypothetical protein|nr:hypothetical protein YH62_20835 [Rhizobium sp. LC145]
MGWKFKAGSQTSYPAAPSLARNGDRVTHGNPRSERQVGRALPFAKIRDIHPEPALPTPEKHPLANKRERIGYESKTQEDSVFVHRYI